MISVLIFGFLWWPSSSSSTSSAPPRQEGPVFLYYVPSKQQVMSLIEKLEKKLKQTLPEAQRTQDIESKTWIISKRWNKCRFQFSTLSLPPLLGNHLSHLVHLPVILLAHHHLNENRYLPMHCSNNILSPKWSQLTSSNIPCNSCTTTLPTPLVVSTI